MKKSCNQASYSQRTATSDFFFAPFKKADKSILLHVSKCESFYEYFKKSYLERSNYFCELTACHGIITRIALVVPEWDIWDA